MIMRSSMGRSSAAIAVHGVVYNYSLYYSYLTYMLAQGRGGGGGMKKALLRRSSVATGRAGRRHMFDLHDQR